MLLTIREGTFIIDDNGFKIITQDSEDAKYKYKINY